ncbi:MAG: HlyC/CorC family transporter [Candidatus Omnitrophica bacterium]|nr:HlyC/CorC family transporter [Candidatus Omnitrophota bacterium]
MTISELIVAGVLVAVSAFLSLSEIALVGISKLRLRHLVDRKVKRARMVEKLVAQIDQVITTILVGSNFVNAALTSIVTAACVAWLGGSAGVAAASLIAGSIILILTDVFPKVYASRHADRVSLQVAPVMSLLVSVFRPVAGSVTRMTYAVLKRIGVPISPRSPLITEEEIKLMIEMGKEEGVLGEHERMMLHRIFEFGDLKVGDVMVPLARVVVVPETASHDEVLTVLTEEGHSRIPVYRQTPDRIVGVIYAQELVHIWREGWLIVLQDLIHPPLEVPPTLRVTDLLLTFQKRKLQIAIVVDAGGKALGLVTLEDLVEEIVGEIHEGRG